jgi:hypothetical protein
MRSVANMPGIGGSMGMCGLCGDGFLMEIMLGKRVQTIEITGFDKDVCLHDKCMAVLEANGPDWRSLPDGPLRRAYANADELSQAAGAVDPGVPVPKATD